MPAIKKKAIKIAGELGKTSFKGSTGWFYRFMRRKRLSRRIGTHVIQKLCDDYLKKIEEFLFEIKK